MLRPGGGGGIEYTTRNEVQIFCVIKCIEAFQVTLANHDHLAYPLLRHGFYSIYVLPAKRPNRVKRSQHLKEDPNLVPKSQMILMKTDKNATRRNFHLILSHLFKSPPSTSSIFNNCYLVK